MIIIIIIRHVIDTIIMPGQQSDVGAVLSSPEGGHPYAITALSALRAVARLILKGHCP